MNRATAAGGVSFDALDGTLMLKAMPDTYAVGEMLDWEAPTGGYLLQACFSTAVLAARAILAGTSGALREGAVQFSPEATSTTME